MGNFLNSTVFAVNKQTPSSAKHVNLGRKNNGLPAVSDSMHTHARLTKIGTPASYFGQYRDNFSKEHLDLS